MDKPLSKNFPVIVMKKGLILRRFRSGFTLLEIIIVIIIIGVLTSLALPRLSSVVEGSRTAEALVCYCNDTCVDGMMLFDE